MLTSKLTIGGLIGAGCFGEVYKGQDPVHGTVAVKSIRKGIGESNAEWADRKAGLLREAQLLKKATHRNVVQVYSIFEADTDDVMLFVMDLCGGGSLQARFEQGPMTLQAVRNAATDVVQGLQALHANGMLHRDIKPSNLLVNDASVIQLGDFGLVTDSLVFGYAAQAGYNDHLAFEIWEGEPTSQRTDIWALGITIYRLLHGQAWYGAAPAPQDVVKNGGFADSLQWLPHIPMEWRRFVRKMLRDDKKERFQTATEVFAALSALRIDPNWECAVEPDRIGWVRTDRGRRIAVEWSFADPKKATWTARSEPLGAKGRGRTLSGSAKPRTKAQLEKELQAFFKKY